MTPVECELRTTHLNPDETLGELFIEGQYECVTLEDEVRTVKVDKETAIPAGRYRMRLTWSNRFKQPMWLIEDVPGFTGIRIHILNNDDETEGCIGTGEAIGADGHTIVRSGVAYQHFMEKTLSFLDEGRNELWFTVLPREAA
jgi:hypothetical protein